MPAVDGTLTFNREPPISGLESSQIPKCACNIGENERRDCRIPPAISRHLAAYGDIYFGLWYPIVVAIITMIVDLVFLRETKGRRYGERLGRRDPKQDLITTLAGRRTPPAAVSQPPCAGFFMHAHFCGRQPFATFASH